MCWLALYVSYHIKKSNFMLVSDITECEDGTDECNDTATCTNTIGSYECQCNEGFTGDGRSCMGK